MLSILTLATLLAFAHRFSLAKLAIVIDDFYRPHTENEVLALPSNISVAVLPNARRTRRNGN